MAVIQATPAREAAQHLPLPVRRRIVEFDVMRGVAIVFVVYLHAWFSPWAVTPHREKLAIHVIHLFGHSAVPVFFFISAYLLASDRSRDWKDFAARKLRRIVVPLAVAFVATVLFRLWQEGWTPALGHDLLFFNVAGQYYYLFVLVMFMVAYYPLRLVSNRTLTVLLAVAFAINLAAISFYEHSSITGDFAILAYRNPAVWVFSFTFGYWASRRGDDLAFTLRLLPLALIAMAVDLAVYLAWGERFGHYPVSYFGVTVFLFSSCGLIAYPALARFALAAWPLRIALRPFEDLSRFAYAIFLVHMPFFLGWFTQKYVANSGVRNDYWELMNTRFLAGFLATVIFVVAVAWLWPWGAERLLGVDPPRRRAELVG